MAPNPNSNAQRPHPDRGAVWIDSRRRDEDITMRDATSSRGGGDGREAARGRRADDTSSAPRHFEANLYLAIIKCGCPICTDYLNHILEEGGVKNNASLAEAKRRLTEHLISTNSGVSADRIQQDLDEARRQIDEKNSEIERLKERLAQREAEVERTRRGDDRNYDNPRVEHSQPLSANYGGRYRDEPYWGYRHRDRSPNRKRELPDDLRRVDYDEPPRRQARDEAYDGSRRDRRDERHRGDWRDDRPRREWRGENDRYPRRDDRREPYGHERREMSRASSSHKGKKPASPARSEVKYIPDGYMPEGYDGLVDDNSEYTADDLSTDEDEPHRTGRRAAAKHQARAQAGYGAPLLVLPTPPANPEASGFLGDRVVYIEEWHPHIQGRTNDNELPGQARYNTLNGRAQSANNVATDKRTPYQRAIAPFAIIPRVSGTRSQGHRRPPLVDDGLAIHLMYAIREPAVQPRGVYVFFVPHRVNVHGVAISQLRTLLTLRRMMPFHNDIFSTAAARDHFAFTSDFADAIVRIFAVPPNSVTNTGGYMAYQLHLNLLTTNAQRAIRRWDRQVDGALSPENVVRFLVTSGISVAEYNDMLPFAMQVLWDDVTYGVRGDTAAALYSQCLEIIIRNGGRWPPGIPGPSIFIGEPSTDFSVMYAQPRLPGAGQPLLVHTGSTENLSTTILDSSPHLRDIRLVGAQQLGFATGIPRAPWPAPATNQDTEMADVQPSTSTGPLPQASASSSSPAEASATGPGSSSVHDPAASPAMATVNNAAQSNSDSAGPQEMEVVVEDNTSATDATKTGDDKAKDANGEGSGATSTTR